MPHPHQIVGQMGKALRKRPYRSEGQLPNLASSRGDLKKQEADEVGGLFLEQEPRTPPLKEKGCQGNGAPIRDLNSTLIYGNDTISSCAMAKVNQKAESPAIMLLRDLS